MPFEVKMPQLGMNQDSAVIVSWLKAAGDRISKGDAIFEVETDKATMEVEAAADGFLAGIVAGEGDDVPVGDLIALIVDSEAEVGDHAAATAPRKTEPEPTPTEKPVKESPAPTPDPVAPSQKTPEPARTAGKVLASPLAKRLAKERGIDLGMMRLQGIAEPIHAADLAVVASGTPSHLFARVDGTALDALLSRSDGANRTPLFASFAAGGWRAVFAAEDITVAILGLDGSLARHGEPAGADAAPALWLIDLCDTRLGGYTPAGNATTLAVARDGPTYTLTLSFGEATLPLPSAIALLDEIAARVEDPIRQLL